MHPLIENLSALRIQEIEEKINDLTKKYFLTSNVHVKNQIVSILGDYKDELSNRRQEELKRALESRDKDIDQLINVD